VTPFRSLAVAFTATWPGVGAASQLFAVDALRLTTGAVVSALAVLTTTPGETAELPAASNAFAIKV
jgi:hypothetical protein